MIQQVLWVAAGGAAGAVMRYLISDWMYRRWPSAFPWGTLTVNVAGCLLIGVMAHAIQTTALSPAMRLLLVTGLLGALTTFSTFGLETIRCLHDHHWQLALANILANVMLGVLAVSLGMTLGRLLFGVR